MGTGQSIAFDRECLYLVIVAEMTYYVSSGMLNPTHSLTHLFSSLIWAEPVNSVQQNVSPTNQKHHSIMWHKTHFNILNHLHTECDRLMDRIMVIKQYVLIKITLSRTTYDHITRISDVTDHTFCVFQLHLLFVHHYFSLSRDANAFAQCLFQLRDPVLAVADYTLYNKDLSVGSLVELQHEQIHRHSVYILTVDVVCSER